MAKSSGKSGRVVIPEAKEYLNNMKYEIARELGLLDRVKAVGWAGLSAKETGRIGGLMGREARAAPSAVPKPLAVPVPFAVPKPLTVPEPPDSQATKEGE